MALFGLKTKHSKAPQVSQNLEVFLKNFSIEVMPRTAEKIENFKDILPKNTRVYIAHIEGTPIEDMVDTARRLAEDGFPTMPHFPARIISNKAMLNDWITRYQGEAGVDQALLLAGGVSKPHGEYKSSMDLLETGLFDSQFTNVDFPAFGGPMTAIRKPSLKISPRLPSLRPFSISLINTLISSPKLVRVLSGISSSGKSMYASTCAALFVAFSRHPKAISLKAPST